MPPHQLAATGAVSLLTLRDDVPRSQAVDHWRGTHAQLAARAPGIRDYRQHHFTAESPGLWPATDGVQTRIERRGRVDGVAELTFTAPWSNPLGARRRALAVADNPNVFRRTEYYAAAPQGPQRGEQPQARTGARLVALLRRHDGMAAGQLTQLLQQLGHTLTAFPGVTDVSCQLLDLRPGRSWSAPGVATEEQPFHAAIMIGAGDDAAIDGALASLEVAAAGQTIAAVCNAVHAYRVEATYVFTRDGRPTLPQDAPVRKPRLQPVRRHVAPGPEVPAPTKSFPRSSLVRLPGHGPEDVVVGADGSLYCGVAGGDIVRVDPETRAATVVATTQGRPLGLEALADGRLIVCDARRGLLRVDPADGSVEVLTAYVDDVPLRFCSNATAASDGTIWFTESTTRFDFEHFAGAFLEHRPSGRLLRRDPDGTVDVVLDDLYFANGVALTPDGSGLVLVETAAYRISRVALNGPEAGRRQTLHDDLPGTPDNLSAFVDGRAWVAFTNPRSADLDRAGSMPGFVRKAAWRLPAQLTPRPASIVWVRAITEDGALVEDLHEVREDFQLATGAVELDKKLYIASPEQGSLLCLDLV